MPEQVARLLLREYIDLNLRGELVPFVRAGGYGTESKLFVGGFMASPIVLARSSSRFSVIANEPRELDRCEPRERPRVARAPPSLAGSLECLRSVLSSMYAAIALRPRCVESFCSSFRGAAGSFGRALTGVDSLYRGCFPLSGMVSSEDEGQAT